MRRPAKTFRRDANPRDPRKDLSEKQLAAIGAIILAFNECEGVINALLFVSLRPPPQLMHEVITRISGLDVKVDIVKKAAEHVLGIDQPHLTFIRAALDEFLLYKRYRDAIAHVQVSDNTVPMGYVAKREKLFEVLLSDEALGALYERLWALKADLDVISVAFDAKGVGVLKLEAERILAIGRADHHYTYNIDPVHLEYRLRNIETNRANLAHGRLPSKWFALAQPPYGTSMPQSGRRPQHQSRPRRSRPTVVLVRFAPKATNQGTGSN
jgi:hypothetical protein